ncbi:MAG TPA: hypothetical protein ENJ51_10430 [Leucothrix mucor]|uniref:Type II secretion system protein GspC N-terminal domain-containing protein n=1 Tax=Leucothrix mucor TaxID=45248 RepID=A0A7V2WVV4_LEUMU|nr:hypothetical protein [Leucothrix mucor]
MTLTQNYPQLKKLPQWLTVLLVALLGFALAKLLWMFLTPEEKVVTRAVSTQSSTIAKPKKKQNYGKIIAGQHLFGVVKKKVVKAKPKPKKKVVKAPPKPPAVVIPKITVKLFGIMSYSSQTSGYALLSFNGQPQKVYSLGESLEKKDKKNKDKKKKIFISEITAEKVIVNNHGKFEEFLLSKYSKLSGGNNQPTRTDVLVAGPGGFKPSIAPPGYNKKRMKSPPKAKPKPKPSPVPPKSTPNSDEFSVKNMSKFREEMMADPSKLMEIANAQPYTKDGKLIGFRVRAGKRRRVFRQLGLRNGDIVKEVNGIVIDSSEKGIMLMSELSGASDLSITVLRGKRELHLPTLHF